MIKLTHLIVGEAYNLVGFVAEGKDKDFGRIGTGTQSSPVTLKYLFDINFSNKQIAAHKGKIVEKAGFKLNKLPMLMLSGDGYKPIDNTITLTKRFVQNNENIGFEVEIGGMGKSKFSYENTIKMCDMFRPTNFIIRFGTDREGKQTKRFIAGKPNMPLSMLPVEVVGKTTEAKRTKSTTKAVDNITGTQVYEQDILELYSYIKDVDGFIINLPGTVYKATTESASVGENFVPFNIGEIGTPILDFNETKFNVNCNFKRPGAVAMKLSNNKTTNVITFVYRRKNVFFNAENYIKKLGVVIPADKESELLTKFGRSMALTEITEPGMIQPISMLIGRIGMKFYEVDTSKIGIIAKSKLSGMVMDTPKLYYSVMQLTVSKLRIKYINGLLKELQEMGCVVESEKIKDIAPQFAAMNTTDLEILSENGVDIYSGAYTIKDDNRKTSGVSGEDTVEIAYEIEGLTPKSLTYKQMVEGGPKVPDFLASVIDGLSKIENLGERAIKAKEILAEEQKKADEAKRALWLHKCAMYMLSNKSGVHSHDKRNWEVNTKRRVKAKCYNCKLKGCENLQVLLMNVDIR